jgi:hypothetical protein
MAYPMRALVSHHGLSYEGTDKSSRAILSRYPQLFMSYPKKVLISLYGVSYGAVSHIPRIGGALATLMGDDHVSHRRRTLTLRVMHLSLMGDARSP